MGEWHAGIAWLYCQIIYFVQFQECCWLSSKMPTCFSLSVREFFGHALWPHCLRRPSMFQGMSVFCFFLEYVKLLDFLNFTVWCLALALISACTDVLKQIHMTIWLILDSTLSCNLLTVSFGDLLSCPHHLPYFAKWMNKLIISSCHQPICFKLYHFYSHRI